MRRRIYGGKPHDRLAGALDSFARFLLVRERFDEAHAQLDEALSIYKTIFGPEHSMVAACLDSIGLTEIGQRRFADAQTHLRESIAIYASHAKDSGMSDDLAVTRSELAVALMEDGKIDEAAVQIESALAALREQHGEQIPATAQIKVRLAETRLALIRNDPAKALGLTERIRAVLATQRSPNPSFVALNAYFRAAALSGLKRPDEAMAEIERALSTLRSALPDAHSRIAALLALRARIERDSGKEKEAKTTIAEARALHVPASLLSSDDAETLALTTH